MSSTGSLVPCAAAAARLARHPHTLARDLRTGTLPGVKVGGRWYMRADELDALTGR